MCSHPNECSEYRTVAFYPIFPENNEFGKYTLYQYSFQKTKKEKFVDQYFHIVLNGIETHENDLYPKKLRITAQYSNQSYTTSFSTTRKKKQFIEMLRNQINT